MHSVTQAWQFVKDRRFAILTAHCDDLSLDENVERGAQLKAAISGAGLGFWQLNGIRIRDKTEPGEPPVEEESFLVSVNRDSRNDLRGFVLGQIRKWTQSAAVIRNEVGGPVSILHLDGTTTPIGNFSPDEVAVAYGKINGGQTFVFKSATVPRGWAGTLADMHRTRL